MTAIIQFTKKKRQFLPVKILFTALFFICFFSAFGQQTDPPGYNAEKERQDAIKMGVHADEFEGYLQMRKNYYVFMRNLEKNGTGTTATIPPLTFTRKASGDCPGDFENGTVYPWTGYTGFNATGLSGVLGNTATFTAGTVTGRHTIVTPGYDPTIPFLPRVHSGNYSLQLGNTGTGAELDRVSQTVTATGSCVSFWYALVFHRPIAHLENNNPFFVVRVKTIGGTVIGSFVRTSWYDPFFTNYDSVGDTVYRAWTKHTIDLGCQYENTTVVLEFTVADCQMNGHFGYAYIDDVCFGDCCCTSCSEFIVNPDLYTTYPIIAYKGSTDEECCYSFNLPFLSAPTFKCDPYRIKIFDKNTGTVYKDYQSTIPINGGTFNPDTMDFCINCAGFTSPKTLKIAFYDKNGTLICDSIERVIQPCYSSSGCNCSTLFANPSFAQASTIRKDTANSTSTQCCFIFKPFTDESIIKCFYYGVRVYIDGEADYGTSMFVDLKMPVPIGGHGDGNFPDDSAMFCVDKSRFSGGPISFRIEYLDIFSRIICSKTETLDCEETCCEDITYTVRNMPSLPGGACCYRIEIGAWPCNKAHTAQLMKKTSTGWTTAGTDTLHISRPMFFDMCVGNGDSTTYMVFVKDSTGKVICSKEFKFNCPNCCNLVSYNAVYVSTPGADRCCWDIHLSPTANEQCNIWNWGMYNTREEVPASLPPFLPPSSPYVFTACTDQIAPPIVPPGQSITVNISITRYLAVYDNSGKLLCIKPIVLTCSRTFTNNGGPIGGGGPESCCGEVHGLVANPNPFDNTFTLQAELPQATAVNAKIINSLGELVWEHNYGQQPAGIFRREISLAGQPSGVYTLSVNDGKAAVQIVKQ